jgi:hypothetical protein
MTYVFIILVIVVGGAAFLGAQHVRHENGPGSRPSMFAARRTVRQSRLADSDLCVCGGTLRPSGVVSEQFGTLLSCTGCRRAWTEDGRTMVRRRTTRRRAAGAPPLGLTPSDPPPTAGR